MVDERLFALYIDGGVTDERPSRIVERFGLVRPEDPSFAVDLLAVEMPEGYAYAKVREQDLIATAAQAGAFVGAAEALGHPVTTCSAAEWRRAIVGNPSATDRQIEAVLRLRIHGLPVRCSVHVRDAAGAALYCALREGARRTMAGAVKKKARTA
jgi:Holliday junction resolvasome RuvABC endonuclease subunit